MLSQNKSLWLRPLTFSFLLILALAGSTLGQDINPRVLATGSIPRNLLPQLTQRLSQFIEYQRTQQWDKLSVYLADFYLSTIERKKIGYTPEEMSLMIEVIKEKPIINFTPQQTTASTRNLSVSLNRKEWEIWGCAEFREQNQNLKTKALVMAYYQNRNWVFSQIKLFKRSVDGSTVPCQRGAE